MYKYVRLAKFCVATITQHSFDHNVIYLGEYCVTVDDIQSVMTLVRQSLGDLPIVDDELKLAAGESAYGFNQRADANFSCLKMSAASFVKLSHVS